MSDNMVTFHGVQVPEADVLKAAREIQQREEQKPVEPGVYRWAYMTDAEPLSMGQALRRKNTNGSWDYAHAWGVWQSLGGCCDHHVREGRLVPLQPVEGVEYEGGDGLPRRWRNRRWEMCAAHSDRWLVSCDGDKFWRTGQLRPIVPTPWVPTVGEWVQHKTQPWAKARRVTDVIGKSVRVNGAFVLQAIANLRPATPEEIIHAKRIELVDRLIVWRKADGSVWQRRHGVINYWLRLSESGCEDMGSLDLDHYDILSEYTVHGAKR